MKVIAYGPSGPKPIVPETLILELGGHLAVVRVNGETTDTNPLDIETQIASGELSELSIPETYVDGSWMVLDNSGPEWVLKTDLDSWKLERSEVRLRDSADDPNDRLGDLEAAARLRSIDLQSLVKGLQARALPGESMANTFLRLRGKNA